MAAAGEALDDLLREILAHLAEGLFPLAQWIKDKDTRFPPPLPDAPWRQAGHSLAPNDTGAIDFFAELLQETAGDTQLLARWQEVGANPLRFSPLDNPQDWRAQRGLADARFGIVESDDVLNLVSGGSRVPISRQTFYPPYWPLLKQAAAAANPQGVDQWASFAAQLFTDTCPVWPAGPPLSSSLFAVQFARDLLYAMMGMRNQAPAGDPWTQALLIELGETRRTGNHFTPEDVASAVEAFDAVIDTFRPNPG
jgi:hypothetical protein